jgi:Bifunctional DNA primase/polymerase, N-terminal
MGVFTEWQPRYLAERIATFPVIIDETGKRPAVKHYLKMGTDRSTELAGKPQFANCNGIGFRVDRPYGPKITVLDIDIADEREVTRAIERHGDTEIIVKTASGKFHLYYRHAGEHRMVRPWGQEVPIDILGGGMVIAAPSIGPKGIYHFVKGGLDQVHSLPPMRGIDDLLKKPKEELAGNSGVIREGKRNKSLWETCAWRSRIWSACIIPIAGSQWTTTWLPFFAARGRNSAMEPHRIQPRRRPGEPLREPFGSVRRSSPPPNSR